MTKAEHILAIVESGINVKKRIEEFLEPCYYPKGGVDWCPIDQYGSKDVTDIKQAEPGMRCCQIIGDDPQSGSLYCGKPAHLYGWSKAYPGMYYVFCCDHARRNRLTLKEKEVL